MIAISVVKITDLIRFPKIEIPDALYISWGMDTMLWERRGVVTCGIGALTGLSFIAQLLPVSLRKYNAKLFYHSEARSVTF
jgi:hypothetical protein